MFPAWDTERCSTLSPFIVGEIIRGRIGFDGLLMSDDLDMQALKGDVPSRAAGAIAAGCDIALNCWGRMDEMVGIANILPSMIEAGCDRLARAMTTIASVEDFGGMADLIAKRDELLALA
jgi:beta-N-acetylhexosaminidase